MCWLLSEEKLLLGYVWSLVKLFLHYMYCKMLYTGFLFDLISSLKGFTLKGFQEPHGCRWRYKGGCLHRWKTLCKLFNMSWLRRVYFINNNFLSTASWAKCLLPLSSNIKTETEREVRRVIHLFTALFTGYCYSMKIYSRWFRKGSV